MREIIIHDLKRSLSGSWAERILGELDYAVSLSKARQGIYDNTISKALGYLQEQYKKDGRLTKTTVLDVEEILKEMAGDAKSYNIICAAHAHIDMNWQWDYAETVAVTLDTFRTMLDLMKEYPEFIFSQSQASVYRIVEQHDPSMLEEIKNRVKEGRWEVTASTWVETDKNMPNGESLARHILYTKKYLSGLFDLEADSLALDFEPDAFGHNLNIPEICAKGGVKYYYHCRGYDGHNIYRWKAPSGSEIIVYREPLWYNAKIRPDMAVRVPGFCIENGIDSVLMIYGVSDHGGGPTRRDLEKIIEMSGWPIFPEVRFGTNAEYFEMLEKSADKLPVVEHELNYIFSGCYTSQSRLKHANRISEAKLNEAELFSTISSMYAEGSYPKDGFEEAWRKVLFNQFHDILCGAGVQETREFGMGQFQEVMTVANVAEKKALIDIAQKIDTASLPLIDDDMRDNISEGAGVGFSIIDHGVPITERGSGKSRIFHFFNPSMKDRSETTELILWDWPGDKRRIEVLDKDGKPVHHQLMSQDILGNILETRYWGHYYFKMIINIKVPACGYTTYMIHEKDGLDPAVLMYDEQSRIEKPIEYVLENNMLKAVFDNSMGGFISLVDKRSGKDMAGGGVTAVFRLIDEDDSRGMIPWIVGNYMNVTNIDKNIKIIETNTGTELLRQWLRYEVKFRESQLKVTVSLDKDSCGLDFDVTCDWKELGSKGGSVPQLNFFMPLGYKCCEYKYDIPFGTLIRPATDMDVPACSWAMGIPEDSRQSALMLITKTKYGFRSQNDSIALTLLRSSYDPDPYPEFGIHKFGFRIQVIKDHTNNAALIKKAYDYIHPVSLISGKKHKGNLPVKGSFMKLEGDDVIISAVKMAEDDKNSKRIVVRAYETEGRQSRVVLRFKGEISAAWFIDINENRIDGEAAVKIEKNSLSFELEAYSLVTICIET